MKSIIQIERQTGRIINRLGLTPENREQFPEKVQRAKRVQAIRDRYSRNIANAVGLTWQTPVKEVPRLSCTIIAREIYMK